MNDLDIYRAVQAAIKAHGDDAVLHAAQRADALLALGDMEGRRVWQRIEEEIVELQQTKPGEGEAAH